VLKASLFPLPEGPLPHIASTSEPPSAQTAKPVSNLIRFTDAERHAIVRALELTGWRISGHAGAAEMLGLKPTTLHAKMKKLGIHRPSATAHDSSMSASGA
jgi:transcriptional regulator with GAF, ATPase, and Fis domain